MRAGEQEGHEAVAGAQTAGAGTELADDTAAGGLQVQGLQVTLRSRGIRRVLVDDVDLSVPAGRATGIVGESGAGKSLTVRAVTGLLDPRRFDVEGTVRLDGGDLSAMAPRARRAYVAEHASAVFQNPERTLNPTVRVGWQVAESMCKGRDRSARISKGEAKRRSIELMGKVGIADPAERFHAFPHQLSGGMKQRVAIAIALSGRGSTLFCDEPTSSLDVTTQALIMDLLDELRAELHLSVVFITHDLALATSRMDDIVVLYQGRVLERIAASRLAESAAVPYTQALLRAVPGADGKLPPASVRQGDGQRVSTGCPYAALCPRAQPVCSEQVPELTELAPRHLARCWFPGTGTKPGAVAGPGGGAVPVAVKTPAATGPDAVA